MLGCPSPRAGPLPLGARWDLPGGMNCEALHNLPWVQADFGGLLHCARV